MRLLIAIAVAALLLVIVFGDVSLKQQAAEYRSRFLNVDLLWQSNHWHFGVWTPTDIPLKFSGGVTYH